MHVVDYDWLLIDAASGNQSLHLCIIALNCVSMTLTQFKSSKKKFKLYVFKLALNCPLGLILEEDGMKRVTTFCLILHFYIVYLLHLLH